MRTVHPHRVLPAHWQLFVTQSHWRQWCSYSNSTISVERGEALQYIQHPISFSSIPYLFKNQEQRLFLSWQFGCFTMHSLKMYKVCKKGCSNPCQLAMNQSDSDHLQTCLQIFTFLPVVRNKVSIMGKYFILFSYLDSHIQTKFGKKKKRKQKQNQGEAGLACVSS